MALPLTLLDRKHIRPGDRICAAVSGGSDSVALLLLLHEANALPRNGLGAGLSAIHVHHGLRGTEADADLAFVEELCGRLEVPLHVRRASVPDRLAAGVNPSRSETVEEAARILRYQAFEALLAEGQADSVLTAHTLDDQSETVLMKFLRGAWTQGLGGIHPVVVVEPGKASGGASQRTGKIVRPLLGARRSELEEFLRNRSQPWRTDSTNADQAFTRNRLRHHLLPILREYNPSIDSSLAHLSELAREDEAHWEAELARLLPQLILPGRPTRGGGRSVSTAPGDTSVALEIERLRGFDAALRRRVVRGVARKLEVRLNFDETARILALAGLTERPDAEGAASRAPSSLQLSGGLKVERSARELRFSRLAR